MFLMAFLLNALREGGMSKEMSSLKKMEYLYCLNFCFGWRILWDLKYSNSLLNSFCLSWVLRICFSLIVRGNFVCFGTNLDQKIVLGQKTNLR